MLSPPVIIHDCVVCSSRLIKCRLHPSFRLYGLNNAILDGNMWFVLSVEHVPKSIHSRLYKDCHPGTKGTNTQPILYGWTLVRFLFQH
jgi:hypothetical protein